MSKQPKSPAVILQSEYANNEQPRMSQKLKLQSKILNCWLNWPAGREHWEQSSRIAVAELEFGLNFLRNRNRLANQKMRWLQSSGQKTGKMRSHDVRSNTECLTSYLANVSVQHDYVQLFHNSLYEHDHGYQDHHANAPREVGAHADDTSHDDRSNNGGGYANPKNQRGEMTAPG